MKRISRRKNLNGKEVNIVKKLIAIMAIVSFGFLASSVAFAAGEKVHYLVDTEYDGAATVKGDMTLGEASTNDGQIDLKNATNTFTLSLKSGASAADFNLTLPTADGSANQLLKTDGSGNLGWANDANTTYTAGDGLDLTAEEFSLDLKADSGLEIIATELAVKLDGSTLVMGAGGLKVDTVAGVTGANEDNLGNDDLDALQNVAALTEADGDILIYDTSWKVLVKGTEGQVLKMGATLPAWGADAGEEVIWQRSDTTISPQNANDNLNMGTGALTIGKVTASDDVELVEAKKVVLNSDDVGDSYIIANTDDTVSFWRQGTEYMRFE